MDCNYQTSAVEDVDVVQQLQIKVYSTNAELRNNKFKETTLTFYEYSINSYQFKEYWVHTEYLTYLILMKGRKACRKLELMCCGYFNKDDAS